MWKRQQQQLDDQHSTKKLKINNHSNNTNTIPSVSTSYDNNSTITNTNNHTILILIDNDINTIKSNSFNLLKLKFENQQLGKKLWLENRELKHYEYIPIEFSKDSYFVSNFINRMDQNDYKYYEQNWYKNDYFNILSDKLKMEFETVSYNDIANFDGDSDSISQINRVCNQSETKCIDIICKISKEINDIDEFNDYYKNAFPFINNLLNSEEFLLKCISKKYTVFGFIENRVRKQFLLHENEHEQQQYDSEFILKCAIANIKVLRYVDAKCPIINDKQLLMKLLKSIKMNTGSYGVELFRNLSNELTNDREIVLLAVEKGFNALKYIDSTSELLNDREIVLGSVRHNGYALKYASTQLHNDREIVLEAIRNDGYALEYASEIFKQDREIILEAIKTSHTNLGNIPNELLSNREFILECVKINGLCLEHVPDAFKNDIEIINESIKQNPFSIAYITNNSKKDDCKITLLNVVDKMHLKYIDDTYQYIEILQSIDDLNVIIKLIEAIPFSIHFINEEIRTNYKELIYKSTLLKNGYWMKHSEDAYQQRINHAYYSAKIDSNSGGDGDGGSEINYYRNLNREKLFWNEDSEWFEEWEE